MNTANWVQILDEAVNTLGKGMNPTILLPAMGKIVQTVFFNVGMATCLGEGKLWIQTC